MEVVNIMFEFGEIKRNPMLQMGRFVQCRVCSAGDWWVTAISSGLSSWFSFVAVDLPEGPFLSPRSGRV